MGRRFFIKCNDGRQDSFITMIFVLISMTITSTSSLLSPPFPSGNSTRTSFCSALAKLKSGKSTIATALTGLTVNVAVAPNVAPFEMLVNQTSGKVYGGFSFALQQSLATAGGFKFKYVLVPNRPTNMSITNWLSRITPFVDLVADTKYEDTPDRRSKGLSFTAGYEDMGGVLVTTVLTAPPALDVFNFAKPFSNSLWVLICMTIIFNSLLLWILHIFDPDIICTDKLKKLVDTFFKSVYSFNNALWNTAKTLPTRIVNVAYCLLLLIVVATYTATLASVLFVPEVSKPTVQSMDEAQAQQMTICVLEGSMMVPIVLRYPGVVPLFVSGNDASKVLRKVSDGVCQGAVVSKADYDLFSHNGYANPNCNLFIVGPTLQQVNGAWPYVTAFNAPYCTSLVEATLSALIIGKRADGSLATLYNSAVAASGTINCLTIGGKGGASQTLRLQGYSGIVVIYAIICCFVMFFFLVMSVWSHIQHRNHVADAERRQSQQTAIAQLFHNLKEVGHHRLHPKIHHNDTESSGHDDDRRPGGTTSTIVQKIKAMDESLRPPCEELFRTYSCSLGDMCPYAHSKHAMHRLWRKEYVTIKTMTNTLESNPWNPDPDKV